MDNDTVFAPVLEKLSGNRNPKVRLKRVDINPVGVQGKADDHTASALNSSW
jgi:hypothetical protein